MLIAKSDEELQGFLECVIINNISCFDHSFSTSASVTDLGFKFSKQGRVQFYNAYMTPKVKFWVSTCLLPEGEWKKHQSAVQPNIPRLLHRYRMPKWSDQLRKEVSAYLISLQQKSPLWELFLTVLDDARRRLKSNVLFPLASRTEWLWVRCASSVLMALKLPLILRSRQAVVDLLQKRSMGQISES
eukprot:TRINITY_DN8625_c0_g1_i2.p1 TRINITY_DN8625_c0_g1~~TRINITY_DN8625_c0_g1_i2.p1  ORF type:complete len:187 (-),score=5.85 TRINITY_DN8625_c0_g1_i2:402-962(-)